MTKLVEGEMKSENFLLVHSQLHLSGCEWPGTKNFLCLRLMRFVVGGGLVFNEQDIACGVFDCIAHYTELLFGQRQS